MWKSEVSQAVVSMIAPAAGERAVDLEAGMVSANMIAARSGASVVDVEPTSYERRLLGMRRRWPLDRGPIAKVDRAAESIPMAECGVDALSTVNTIHCRTDRGKAARELSRVLLA